MQWEDRSTSNLEVDLSINDLAEIPYQQALELQKDLQQQRINGSIPDTLLVCSHPPVITVGKSADPESLLVSKAEFAHRGIELYEVGRGGDATYHGPGQIVLYPIIDLKQHKRDVAWYMRSLEQVIIQTLQAFEIKGLRFEGRTGVWTQVSENDIENPPRKIASIGVRISRWCTMHGLALNVRDSLDNFSLINPCGYTDISVTSMQNEGYRPADQSKVQAELVKQFVTVFNYGRTEQR